MLDIIYLETAIAKLDHPMARILGEHRASQALCKNSVSDQQLPILSGCLLFVSHYSELTMVPRLLATCYSRTRSWGSDGLEKFSFGCYALLSLPGHVMSASPAGLKNSTRGEAWASSRLSNSSSRLRILLLSTHYWSWREVMRLSRNADWGSVSVRAASLRSFSNQLQDLPGLQTLFTIYGNLNRVIDPTQSCDK